MATAEKRKVFVHIGTEKTGSTSLQAFLQENEAALNLSGYSYFCSPEKPYFERNGHFPIAACFSSVTPDFVSEEKHRDRNSVLEVLHRDLSLDNRHAILSAEHFSSRLTSLEDLETFKSALSPREVTIVVYIRPQDELACSNYSTAINCGYQRSFSLDEVDPVNPYYNYLRMLMPYAQVFGKERILVRNYKALEDIRIDFLTQIGIQKSHPYKLSQNLNESMSLGQLEILREINQILLPFGKCSHTEYVHSLNLRSIIAKALPSAGGGASGLLSKSERIRILEMFRSSNDSIEQQYLESNALIDWYTQGYENEPSSDFDLKSLFAQGLLSLAQQTVQLSNASDQTILELRNQIQSHKEQISELQELIINHRHRLSELDNERRTIKEQHSQIELKYNSTIESKLKRLFRIRSS